MQIDSLPQPTRALSPLCFLVEEERDLCAEPLPDIPVLLSTRLQLELLLQERVLDLRAVSEVILQDLGATLQILRLVGEEYGGADDRPIRIEDCIACLDVQVWFDAVSSITLVQNSHAAGAWQHARQIGRYAEQLAGLEEGLRPGEGQMVGLLHEIGRLPELLGWPRAFLPYEDRSVLGAMLAEQWRLPGCVLAGVREHQAESSPTESQWAMILRAAHACAQQEDARARLDCQAAASCA